MSEWPTFDEMREANRELANDPNTTYERWELVCEPGCTPQSDEYVADA